MNVRLYIRSLYMYKRPSGLMAPQPIHVIASQPQSMAASFGHQKGISKGSMT